MPVNFGRLILLYTIATIDLFIGKMMDWKMMIVGKLFWGRSSAYKTWLHLSVVFISISLLFTGLAGVIFGKTAQAASPLALSYAAVSDQDLLQQGVSITTVAAAVDSPLEVFANKHTVVAGENLDSIAADYGVAKDTIKWANKDKIDYYRENVVAGWELLIPVMNGVLTKVEPNETLEQLVNRTKGNRFDIIELNELVPPNYDLSGKEYVFIPNGILAPPPPPPPRIPRPVITGYIPGSGGYVPSGVEAAALNGIAFDDPLSNSRCSGYVYMRGVSAWHDGVDIAKNGGCPIRAAAAGTIIFAGWSGYGGGYTVTIDHGNGVTSSYLHGNGDIWVSKGMPVAKGQDIMYMGSTGNSTGVHMHITLKVNGKAVDPSKYVPYKR